jgi:Ca2+-dependent lipid-binding protein
LNVVLHEGKNLPQSDNWGLCDGFVRMEINGQSWESSVQRNTLRPVWEDEVQFIVSDKSEDLKITLFDWDMAGEELLGSLNISCEELSELGDELKHHLWAMTQADEANQVRTSHHPVTITLMSRFDLSPSCHHHFDVKI